MDQVTTTVFVTRLLVAMVIGAAMGVEREYRGKPAGIRTYLLVTEGSALFMLCGILLSQSMANWENFSDPGRLASTVVQGIGFIAAGVILASGRHIMGLTTAAEIWVAAAIGLLIGAGYEVLGTIAAAMTVVGMVTLLPIERMLHQLHKSRHGGTAAPESEDPTA